MREPAIVDEDLTEENDKVCAELRDKEYKSEKAI